MSYKRKQFDKQRNPVAKHNQYKGGPHGSSSYTTERMRTAQMLKNVEIDDVEDTGNPWEDEAS